MTKNALDFLEEEPKKSALSFLEEEPKKSATAFLGEPDKPSIFPSKEHILAPFKEIPKIPGAVAKAAEFIPRGLAKGLSFGTWAPGQEPISRPGKVGEITGEMISVIPWFVGAEAIATGLLVKGGLKLLAPLSQAVLRATGAGMVYGTMGQIAKKGIVETVTDPVATAQEASLMGSIFAPFGAVGHGISKLITRIMKIPSVPKMAGGKLVQAEIPPQQALGQAIAAEVQRSEYPQVEGANIIRAMRGAKEFNISVETLLTNAEQQVLKEPALKSVLTEAANDPALAWRGLLTKSERMRLKAPFAGEEYVVLGESMGNLSHGEAGVSSKVVPAARVLKASLDPKAAPEGLVDAVAVSKYEQAISGARQVGTETELLTQIEKIKKDPIAWKEAVTEYGNRKGFDVIDFGKEEISVLNAEAISPKLTPEIREQIKNSLPKLLPADALDIMPQIREALQTIPTKKEIGIKIWQLKRRMPKLAPKDVIREMKGWASGFTSAERQAKFVDPEIQGLGTKVKDIGPIQDLLTDWTHAVANSDPTGTIMKKLIYPFKRAEVDAKVWAYKIKANLRKTLKFDRGSKASAAMQRIGEKEVYPERVLPEDIKFDTPEMAKNIEQMRGMYNWYLDSVLNPVRASIGKLPIPKRKDFFTHFQDMAVMERIFGGAQEVPDKYIAEPFIKKNEPFFRSELQRMGETWTEDAIAGFDLYTDGISRVLFLTNPGTKININAKFLPPNLGKHLTDTVSYAFGKTGTSKWSTFWRDSKLGRVGRYLAKRTISNQVVGRLATGMVQYGSVPFVATKGGTWNMVMAHMDIYGSGAAMRRMLARKLSPAVASHALDTTEINPAAFSKIGDLLNLVVRVPDNEMSQLAFWTGMRQASRMGLKGMDRVIHADTLVNSTNATYLRSNTPSLLQGELAEVMIPLQRQMNSLMNTLALDFWKNATWGQRLKNAAVMEFTGIGMNMITRSIAYSLGYEEHRKVWDPRDMIPLYWASKYGFQPPIIRAGNNLARGSIGMISGREGAGKQFARGALMVAPPYGGRMVIDILEGIPLGREPK